MIGILFLVGVALLGLHLSANAKEPTDYIIATTMWVIILGIVAILIQGIQTEKNNTETLLKYMIKHNYLDENISKKFKNDIINIKMQNYKIKLKKELK